MARNRAVAIWLDRIRATTLRIDAALLRSVSLRRQGFQITSHVIPAKAGTQYSREISDESNGRGVLGRPVKPGQAGR